MQPTNVTTSPQQICPFCRSDKVTTTSKTTDDVYWRCHLCGQIWNPSRLSNYPSRFPYRR